MLNNLGLQKYVYFWLALSLSLVFLLYSHLLEVFPTDNLNWFVSAAHLRLGKFDSHSTLLFYATLITQLLIGGILLDKFGIRLLTILAALVAVLGVYFFAQFQSNSLTSWVFSRVLLGCGIAFVTVGYIKVVAGTMPARQFALMGGIFVTAALLGSFFGDATLVGKRLPYTWQQAALLVAAGTLCLAALFYALLRDNQQILPLPAWQEIRRALCNTQNWLLAGYSGVAFAPVAILAGIAGKPFFVETYNYSNQQIILLGCFMLLGLSIGPPLVGHLSNQIKRRRVLMLFGILLQEVTFLPVAYLHGIPYWVQAILLLLFGLASSTFILSFVLGKEINSLAVVGTIISLIQAGIIFITAITDQVFEKFLIWGWDGKIVDGIRCFSSYEYHIAFTIFPVYLLLGFILLLFIDEPIF